MCKRVKAAQEDCQRVDGWAVGWQVAGMSKRRIWLVANWKMHGSREGAVSFSYRVNRAMAQAPANLTSVFCPPTLFVDAARMALPQNARLQLGAQNCHARSDGAFTGEVSAAMLAQAGCSYVILGHSERRTQGGETCAQVLEKAQVAIAAGLVPILCIGETQAEYDGGHTASVLARQAGMFATLDAAHYLIAYEPVWAIGSGKTPTVEEITAAHGYVKSTLGSAVSVLYGGSVKPTNLREILACEGVSGALIGGASLDPDSMIAMVNTACDALGD